MTRIKQEIPPGRIQSQSYHPSYDTVLPDNIRAELRAPRTRPRILGRKPLEPTKLSAPRLLFAVFLVLLAVSAICLTLRERVPLERSLPSPAVTQPAPQSITLAPTPAPTPRAIAPLPVSPPAIAPAPALRLDAPRAEISAPQPEPTPDVDWHSAPILPHPPRAQLLKLPPPKAHVIRLPDLPPAPRAIRMLQRARETRARDLHAPQREINEVMRRIQSQ